MKHDTLIKAIRRNIAELQEAQDRRELTEGERLSLKAHLALLERLVGPTITEVEDVG